MNGMDLLMKYETEGLETHEEAVALAEWMVETGLVNSKGDYGRFVRSVQSGDDDGGAW